MLPILTEQEMKEDILQEIPNTDLPLLSEIYKNYVKEAPQVYSLLNTCIRWKNLRPNTKYLTFMGVNEDWLESGTFILLMQYACYDLFIFTLQEDCKTLHKALVETKKIQWNNKVLWYAVLSRHAPTVFSVVTDLCLRLDHQTETGLWVIDKDKALDFDISCPDEVYIGKLNKSHAQIVNAHWPHRYLNSEQYLGTFIEMNDSYGIFLKSDDTLVCWVLKNHMGQLGILHTIPDYVRKGYATLVTKFMSKEIACEGHNPLGTIIKGNAASEAMFRKLGFRVLDTCSYFLTYM